MLHQVRDVNHLPPVLQVSLWYSCCHWRLCLVTVTEYPVRLSYQLSHETSPYLSATSHHWKTLLSATSISEPVVAVAFCHWLYPYVTHRTEYPCVPKPTSYLPLDGLVSPYWPPLLTSDGSHSLVSIYVAALRLYPVRS